MIVGTGIDIADLRRIRRAYARFCERFCSRILAPEEMADVPERNRAAFLAGRFAAKEACAKALGTGFSEGISPQMIIIRKTGAGQPFVSLKGAAQSRAEAIGAKRLHLSISHEREYAVALAIAED